MRFIVILAVLAVAAGCAPQTVISNRQQAVVEAWSHADAVTHAERQCGRYGRFAHLDRQQGGEYWFSCRDTEETIAARQKAQREEAMKRAAELKLFAAPAASAADIRSASNASSSPMATALPRSGAWVQVGAFLTRAAAERFSRDIRKAHGAVVKGHEVVVDGKPVAGKGTLYVTRLGGFTRTADAKRACGALKRRGTACFVVLLP